MKDRSATESGARVAPLPQGSAMRRQHAQEIDLRALRAVARAAAQGRVEGRKEAARALAETGKRHSRRSRVILIFSVATALLLGLCAGLVLGTRSARTARTMDSAGAPR